MDEVKWQKLNDLLSHRYYELMFSKNVCWSLRCCRCNKVAIELVYLQCNHVLCLACSILKKNMCSICLITKLVKTDCYKEALDGKRQVLDLSVKCPNFTFGCSFEDRLIEIPKHLEECDYENVAKVKEIEDKIDTLKLSELQHKDATSADFKENRSQFKEEKLSELNQPFGSRIPTTSTAFTCIVDKLNDFRSCNFAVNGYDGYNAFIRFTSTKTAAAASAYKIAIQFFTDDPRETIFPVLFKKNCPRLTYMFCEPNQPAGKMLNHFTFYRDIEFNEFKKCMIKAQNVWHKIELDSRMVESCFKDGKLVIIVVIDFPLVAFTDGFVIWEVEDILWYYDHCKDLSSHKFGFSPYFSVGASGHRLQAYLDGSDILKLESSDQLDDAPVTVTLNVVVGTGYETLHERKAFDFKVTLAYRNLNKSREFVFNVAEHWKKGKLQLSTVRKLRNYLIDTNGCLQLKIEVEDLYDETCPDEAEDEDVDISDGEDVDFEGDKDVVAGGDEGIVVGEDEDIIFGDDESVTAIADKSAEDKDDYDGSDGDSNEDDDGDEVGKADEACAAPVSTAGRVNSSHCLTIQATLIPVKVKQTRNDDVKPRQKNLQPKRKK